MWYHSFDSLCIENEKLKSRMEVEKDIMLYIAFYYGLKSGWTELSICTRWGFQYGES